MQFSQILAVLAVVSSAVAAPSPNYKPPPTVYKCPNSIATPECCATDVLGVADLNCAPREFSYAPFPPLASSLHNKKRHTSLTHALFAVSLATKTPKNLQDFVAICAKIGQQAKCCDVPILGQGLICTNAS